MGAKLVELLKTLDEVQQEVEKQFAPVWDCLATEIGLHVHDGVIPKPHTVQVQGRDVYLAYSVALPPTPRHTNRLREVSLRIPGRTLNGRRSDLKAFLRRSFPIRCGTCGSNLPINAARWDATQCSHDMVWRSDAPSPRYYVDAEHLWGYIVPTRGMRFVYDLQENRLVAFEVEGRHSKKWMTPVQSIVDSEMRPFYDCVLPELPNVLAGEPFEHLDPRLLSFELPEWCMQSANKEVGARVRPIAIGTAPSLSNK